jgi:hypothetical protein
MDNRKNSFSTMRSKIDSRKNHSKLNVSSLNHSELLETIYKNRIKKKILTKFPETLNDKSKKKVKFLPELSLHLDSNWKDIFNTHRVLNIRIHNAGQSTAYNVILEIYTTPIEIIKRGPSLGDEQHFQERKHILVDTIYPNEDILVPLYSPGLVLYGALFEPYFLMCYDVLLDPKENIVIDEQNNSLNEYLITSAQNNRKMLYIPPLLDAPILNNQKSDYKRVNISSKFRKTNLKRRK